MHEQISLLEILLLHRYAAQEAQYMPKSRVLVLFISGTLFARTFYIVADSPWPNHMDGSGLVSSTMSPPLGATKHGRTLVLRLFGGPIQANCWPTLQQGPDPRFACADGGRGMAQRAALALIEGFRLFGWCGACACFCNCQLKTNSSLMALLFALFLFFDTRSGSSIESINAFC